MKNIWQILKHVDCRSKPHEIVMFGALIMPDFGQILKQQYSTKDKIGNSSSMDAYFWPLLPNKDFSVKYCTIKLDVYVSCQIVLAFKTAISNIFFFNFRVFLEFAVRSITNHNYQVVYHWSKENMGSKNKVKRCRPFWQIWLDLNEKSPEDGECNFWLKSGRTFFDAIFLPKVAVKIWNSNFPPNLT